jgi:signal transduction histidine kinase
LPSNIIRSLYAETNGTLWIGTVDGGLCRFKDNHFVTCTTHEGLLDDVINCIMDDHLGFLWFTSFQGVFRVSKDELNEFADGKRSRIQCVAFGKSDGLPALECPGGFQPAGCRTKDGHLWFPTIKGLVTVDPATVSSNSVAPRVLIEDMLVDGDSAVTELDAESSLAGSVKKAGSALDNVMKIRPGRHRYEIHYTGLDFTAPERVRFRHRLEGLEEDWVEGVTQRTANYSQLLPGTYRFHVSACNAAGVWNETGAMLAFQVLPYFWETWWFYITTISAGVALMGGAVFWFMFRGWQRQVERLEVQLSVERERTRIAQDIHDGVGANLTEIAWLAELAEKESTDPEEVRQQARKISDTARGTVRSFDEIVWAVLPQNDTLTSLVEYLGRRVDEFFESSSINYRFSAPPELPQVVVPADVRHSFYLACKEALHNVMKHSGATEVKVLVTVGEGWLRVEIEDNGSGFDSDAGLPSGHGLKNMRQRMTDLKGSFELKSSRGQGTKTILTLPLKEAEPQ